jgi:superfamily II RNA helicase
MHYRGFLLDPFQEQAIGHLQDGDSVLVAAPTGTGKTIIADWAVDEALARGKRVVYTAPIKALSNQKYRDYCRLHGEDRVGLVTGDLVIRRQAPCLVMTTEILRNILLGGEDVSDLYAVVVDEVHFLDDRERGTVWEEILIYLPEHVLVVALSATIPNLDEFAAWLSHVRQRPVRIVTEPRRAVPLDEHFVTRGRGILDPKAFHAYARSAAGEVASDRRGNRDRREAPRGRRGGDDDAKGAVQRTRPLDVLDALVDKDWLPALYFVFSRKDAERFAHAIVQRSRHVLLNKDERARASAFIDEASAEVGPALDRTLRDMYLHGIAYHHAGLHVQLKGLVEQLYEMRLIKLLFCTSTFALGINMPARTVVFHSLKKFDGTAVLPLPTRGFMQKAGRAGRRGMDEVGHVVLRMDPDEYPELAPIIERYRKQQYEPVRSSFSLSWNSIVNLLEAHDLEHIRTIVDRSFLAWHRVRVAQEQVERAEQLERAAEDGSGSRKDLKEAGRLRRRADQAGDQCWLEFLHKRDFLRGVGYLAADDSFNAGARVLRHLQISEIFMTELVLSGQLEDLDAATTFGMLCAVTSELPRTVHCNFRYARKDRELMEKVEKVRMSDVVRGAEELTRMPVTFGPDMLPLGRAWCEGQSLEAVMLLITSPTDYAGTLVSSLRRAKDLASQLVDVYAEVPDRAQFYRELVRTVSRDEVEVVG